MGPLMQDFLFLKKIAFSPDVAANMLGNFNWYFLCVLIFCLEMKSTEGKAAVPFPTQVWNRSKTESFVYLLLALDGVSFLKVRSSFWETSGEKKKK